MAERFRLRWTETALGDVESILEYVTARDSIDAATRLGDKLLARIESLQELPRRCRRVPELKVHGISEYRELIVSPHRVCFRVREREVVLLGVLDGRRDLEELLIERALRFDEG